MSLYLIGVFQHHSGAVVSKHSLAKDISGTQALSTINGRRKIQMTNDAQVDLFISRDSRLQ